MGVRQGLDGHTHPSAMILWHASLEKRSNVAFGRFFEKLSDGHGFSVVQAHRLAKLDKFSSLFWPSVWFPQTRLWTRRAPKALSYLDASVSLTFSVRDSRLYDICWLKTPKWHISRIPRQRNPNFVHNLSHLFFIFFAFWSDYRSTWHFSWLNLKVCPIPGMLPQIYTSNLLWDKTKAVWQGVNKIRICRPRNRETRQVLIRKIQIGIYIYIKRRNCICTLTFFFRSMHNRFRLLTCTRQEALVVLSHLFRCDKAPL